MKYPLVPAAAAVLSALLSLPAFAGIDRSITKTFVVQPTGQLRVATFGGNIDVQVSKDGTASVRAIEHIRTDSDAEADKIAQKLELSIEQHGSDIVCSASYPDQGLGFHFGSWPPIGVDFVITVPAGFEANIRTSGGNVVVGDLGGRVHARTSGGNIELGSLGGEADASTSGGNVTLRDGGGRAYLRTSGGEIKVGRVAGPADLSTSGGDIKVESVENELNASTSGGDIRARIVGALKGNSALETSGGSVEITVEGTAGFNLDAATSGGEVTVDHLTVTPADGVVGSSRLKGTVNGGGAVLKLRSSGGDISIKGG
jgi:DUF4097 and DUF4098 domain-containing protein YvlB